MTVYIPFWLIIAILIIGPLPFGMWLEEKGDCLTGLFVAVGSWMLAIGLSAGKLFAWLGWW